ncbi:hypothetical protein [Piscirickettsia salmonis]|uniref:hypothetical protein n=1 Tax=Piscirickettsia salmonis TaxID=1238 RepID=UPI0007C891A5|nr:hypothetical protein A0O36_00036 [Piscirickettsiaceae bacterium NZ-RLO1]
MPRHQLLEKMNGEKILDFDQESYILMNRKVRQCAKAHPGSLIGLTGGAELISVVWRGACAAINIELLNFLADAEKGGIARIREFPAYLTQPDIAGRVGLAMVQQKEENQKSNQGDLTARPIEQHMDFLLNTEWYLGHKQTVSTGPSFLARLALRDIIDELIMDTDSNAYFLGFSQLKHAVVAFKVAGKICYFDSNSGVFALPNTKVESIIAEELAILIESDLQGNHELEGEIGSVVDKLNLGKVEVRKLNIPFVLTAAEAELSRSQEAWRTSESVLRHQRRQELELEQGRSDEQELLRKSEKLEKMSGLFTKVAAKPFASATLFEDRHDEFMNDWELECVDQINQAERAGFCESVIEEIVPVMPQQVIDVTIATFIQESHACISELINWGSEHESQAVKWATGSLAEKLTTDLKVFIDSEGYKSALCIESYRSQIREFISSSEEAQELSIHRGHKGLIGNLLVALTGVGILALGVKAIHSMATRGYVSLFFDTNSMKKVDMIGQNLDAMAAQLKIK